CPGGACRGTSGQNKKASVFYLLQEGFLPVCRRTCPALLRIPHVLRTGLDNRIVVETGDAACQDPADYRCSCPHDNRVIGKDYTLEARARSKFRIVDLPIDILRQGATGEDDLHVGTYAETEIDV